MADKVFCGNVTEKFNGDMLCVGINMAEAEPYIRNGWLNVNVRRSRNGKWYVEVDTWEPQRGAPPSRPTPPQRPAPPARRDDWADPHSNTGYYPGTDGKPLPEEDGEFSDDIPF